MINTCSFLEKVEKTEPDLRYLVRWSCPSSDMQDKFDVQCLEIINGLNVVNPALAKKVTVSRKNMSLSVVNVDQDDIKVISDVLESNKPLVLTVQETFFFNLDPKIKRDDLLKLKLIKAVHKASRLDDVLGDYFFENTSRILDDKALFEDDQQWKLECRTEFASWLVGKEVEIEHHDSQRNEDITLKVKVVNSDQDRIVIFIENLPDELSLKPNEINDIERIPVSIEAIANIDDLVRAYEICVNHGLIWGFPKSETEIDLLKKFGD